MPQFTLGKKTTVKFRDGETGELAKLTLDPDTGKLLSLVVRVGYLFPTYRRVPGSLVEKVKDDDVHLSVQREDLDTFPDTRIQVLPSEPGLLEWEMPVTGPEGDLGNLSQVLVDLDSLNVTHLVIDPGLFSEPRIIPISVAKLEYKEGIQFDAGERDLALFPAFSQREEVEILSDFRHRLKDASFDLMTIKVGLKDGVLHLSGIVPDADVKKWVGSVARSVDGVVEVENALSTDGNVVAWVKGELAADPRTSTSTIKVKSELGVVRLTGKVRSEDVLVRAMEIAARQPDVTTVVNTMVVQPN